MSEGREALIAKKRKKLEEDAKKLAELESSHAKHFDKQRTRTLISLGLGPLDSLQKNDNNSESLYRLTLHKLKNQRAQTRFKKDLIVLAPEFAEQKQLAAEVQTEEATVAAEKKKRDEAKKAKAEQEQRKPEESTS